MSVLFVISFPKKSPSLRNQSLKVAALPLVYIIGLLSLFKFLSWNYNRKVMPQVSGTYHYSLNDSIWVTYTLNANNTFIIQNPNRTFRGTWEIATNTYHLTFYDQDKHEFTRSVLETVAGKKALVFLNNKDTVRLVKQD